MTTPIPIALAGGGTAGHVFPALAVARALQALDRRVQPVFIGTPNRLEDRLVPAAGYALHHVEALPLPRRLSLSLLRLPDGVNASIHRCQQILQEVGALAVAGFGGYVSFPVSRAATRLGLPLVVHEQNAMPGLANRIAARKATRVAVTFPGSADRFADPQRVVVTGNPVREDLLSLDPAAIRTRAREELGLRQDALTILAFGGSLGARSLNRALVKSHDLWAAPESLQIVHATGSGLYDETATAWERAREAGPGPLVRCFDFIEDMGAAYAAADIVISRAGATTIAELTALGLPSLLVPYPHATRDHQMHNARAMVQVGAAQVVADDELTGRRLVDAVEPWLADPDARAAAASAARVFGRRDAAMQVARLVLEQVA